MSAIEAATASVKTLADCQENTKSIFPYALIDYLLKIIGADRNIEFIRLVPAKIGHGVVQEVILEAQDGVEFRKVFGFEPVNTRLQVIHNENAMPLLVTA